MPTLSWLTREKDVKRADGVAYRLLERDDALSVGHADSGNMLIQGDNLEALKSLLPYYRGQVKCIYIDPPYNKGDHLVDGSTEKRAVGRLWQDASKGQSIYVFAEKERDGMTVKQQIIAAIAGAG